MRSDRRSIAPVPQAMLVQCLVTLARFLDNQGQEGYAEAEPLLLENVRDILADRGPDNRRTHEAARRIVDLYEAWGKSESAAPWRAKFSGN